MSLWLERHRNSIIWPDCKLYICNCLLDSHRRNDFTIHISLTFMQPEKCWEADLEEMVSLIDERTKMIVVINPSNPCGSVYTKEHLEAILDGRYDDGNDYESMVLIITV